MDVIHAADARRTETPNAAMTTLASPTQGGSAHAVWRVDMQAGQAGPLHWMDVDQVWTLLSGRAVIVVDGGAHPMDAGDTAVIPADVPRQVLADDARPMSAIVTSSGSGRARVADGTDAGVPPWIS